MFDAETAPLPSDFERQQALDKALSSFSSPTVLQGQNVNNSTAIPGKGFTDRPAVVDEEELSPEDQLALQQQQTEEITEEGDEVDSDTEDTESLSEGFTAEFKKAFGLEPTEAVETFNQLVNFRNEVLLMQEWNVTPGEYRNRMEEVKGFYEGLPEDGKAQFNTPEGAIAIWNHLHPEGAPKQTSKLKTTRKTTSVPKTPKTLFSKSQILQMSPDEFRRNAAAIQQAYLNNQVNESA